MGEINANFPGARRALFAKYHIGGCSSCAYKDTESLLGVCERNEIDVQEAIEHILQSHKSDQTMLISPEEAKALIDAGEKVKFLDVRTREEHEAVAIPDSAFMTQELQQTIFSQAESGYDSEWGGDTYIVLYDHLGKNVLDQCAWFLGHGMKNTKALTGGIDAWSQQIDNSIARYRLEME
eukprot:Seg19322.1 transcript_id=Seg19322.1/GoldUCD/mRNA.D3Y31 product="Adenylyltransferase and sulfurtransferase UBA4" protein_id=Seg19322.1/GoldUCD/D3Y31